MRSISRKPALFSEGARARALAFFLVGCCSGALGFLAVVHLDQRAFLERMTPYQTWIVVASAVGGMIALFLAGDRVGGTGTRKILRYLSGSIWVTFVGALIGGTLALPLYGTMFGPFIVAVTLAGAPLLAVLWISNMFAVNVLMSRYQTERDTIFAPGGSTPHTHADSLTVRMRGRFT